MQIQIIIFNGFYIKIDKIIKIEAFSVIKSEVFWFGAYKLMNLRTCIHTKQPIYQVFLD